MKTIISLPPKYGKTYHAELERYKREMIDMNQLDKVYNADPIKATEKQLDFIIDNLDYLDDERAEQIEKRLDIIGKKEASSIIKEIIEYMNCLNEELLDCVFCPSDVYD